MNRDFHYVFVFRELWKDRFIFRETWSRPPFTTLLIVRIRTKISAFLLLPRNRRTARIYYYSQGKASQEKVRINETAKKRRSRLTTMLRLTDVARFTAMITYEVILNEWDEPNNSLGFFLSSKSNRNIVFSQSTAAVTFRKLWAFIWRRH